MQPEPVLSTRGTKLRLFGKTCITIELNFIAGKLASHYFYNPEEVYGNRAVKILFMNFID